MVDNYLDSVKKQFEYYQSLGERTFAQVSDDDLFWQENEDSNSIAVIVNHIHGNMLSRWTDFLSADGEKDWRQRDQEFEAIIKDREELLRKWKEGWSCLFTALSSVNEENFDQKIFIRNQAHTIVEAVNRQLAHYAYHIGQIVYIGKLRKYDAWNSLSIARGQSKQFNREKFSKGQHGGHFTDDLK